MSIPVDYNVNQICDFNPNIDYIPFASTLHAIQAIYNKSINLPQMSKEAVASSKYYTHLQSTSYMRQLTLMLPVIGNLIIYLNDSAHRTTPAQDPAPVAPASAQQPAPVINKCYEGSLSLELAPSTSTVEVKQVNWAKDLPYLASWTGDEDFLFYNLKFPEGVQIPSQYSYEQVGLSNDRYLVELQFTVNPGYEIISKNDRKLLNFNIKLEITNDPANKKQLKTMAIVNSNYQKQIVNSKISTEIKSQTVIDNPAIDWSKGVVFEANYEENTARLIFTNSFPYSQT